MSHHPTVVRRLRAARLRLAQLPVCELELAFSSLLTLAPGASCAPIYSPLRTFWLFLYQVLSPSMPCQEVTHKALAWLWSERGETASTSPSAYSQARKRLDLNWLLDLDRQLVERIQEAPASLPFGRRLLVVDGSTLSMPDTPANQSRWPQPPGQKPGCGSPTMRIVALFSLATGALINMVHSSRELAEQSLWRRMWGTLKPGDIILADRGFSSFAELYLLTKRRVDVIARRNVSRTSGARRLKRLGKDDWLVEWKRDRHCPRWLHLNYRSALPETILVREITFPVNRTGFRTKSVTVVTTLLEAKLYARASFPELYRRRWDAELRLRDMKTSMGMDVLRTKSPAMIEKELAMYRLAYNLVRGLMAEAGAKYGQEPVRLSFLSCVQLLRQWAPELVRNEEEADQVRECMLRYMARQKLRSRPDRTEPRAIKRRPKAYPRLDKPRHQFQDIPHRNRYKKAELDAMISDT